MQVEAEALPNLGSGTLVKTVSRGQSLWSFLMRGLCPLPLLLPDLEGPDQLLPVYQRRKSPFQRQGKGLSVLVEVPQKLIQRQGTQYQWFMWKLIPGNTSRAAGSKTGKGRVSVKGELLSFHHCW